MGRIFGHGSLHQERIHLKWEEVLFVGACLASFHLKWEEVMGSCLNEELP
jgi:hypothetical protein